MPSAMNGRYRVVACPSALGRVESASDSDCSPETCRSRRLSYLNFEGVGKVRLWPGRAKAEFKLAAVNQSSKAGQQGKF